jgi:hypothetical protein
VEKDRGKPGGITDQDEVFSISVIKGLPGQGEDLTIVRTVVNPKPEPSPSVLVRCAPTARGAHEQGLPRPSGRAGAHRALESPLPIRALGRI